MLPNSNHELLKKRDVAKSEKKRLGIASLYMESFLSLPANQFALDGAAIEVIKLVEERSTHPRMQSGPLSRSRVYVFLPFFSPFPLFFSFFTFFLIKLASSHSTTSHELALRSDRNPGAFVGRRLLEETDTNEPGCQTALFRGTWCGVRASKVFFNVSWKKRRESIGFQKISWPEAYKTAETSERPPRKKR